MNKIIKKLSILILIILMLLITYKVFNIEEKVLKYLYPIKYEEYVYEYSENLNIDPMLTLAIIKTESNFEETAESKSGAIGLMQLMESTAKEASREIEHRLFKRNIISTRNELKIRD